MNPHTGDQITRYVYGTTLASSAVARADLLAAEIYPDIADAADRVSYTCNRQGQIATKTDQNGTVHTFTDDGQGPPDFGCRDHAGNRCGRSRAGHGADAAVLHGGRLCDAGTSFGGGGPAGQNAAARSLCVALGASVILRQNFRLKLGPAAC